VGYQLIQRGGGAQFSIWTYLPHAALVARPILAAALVLLALSPLFRPPVQDVREHAALAAALLIGAQLLLGYWFYSYLTWCYPLIIMAILRSPHRRLLPGDAAEVAEITGIRSEESKTLARTGAWSPRDLSPLPRGAGARRANGRAPARCCRLATE
jgi:hypothetical protein